MNRLEIYFNRYMAILWTFISISKPMQNNYKNYIKNKLIIYNNPASPSQVRSNESLKIDEPTL